MFKTLAFSMIATALLAGSVLAQSNNRQQGSDSRQQGSSNRTQGSDSRANSEAYNQKQQDRENAKAVLKYSGLISRGDFASITLTRDQKTSLKAMVAENLEALNATTGELVNAMPEASRRRFESAFLEARQGGQSAMDAIKTGMATAQIAEDVQQQVLALNAPRQAVLDRINTGVRATLTPEQLTTLGPAAQTEAVQEGSGARTAPASGTRPAPASGARPAPASGTRPAPASGTRPAPASGTKPAPAASGAKPGSSSR